MHFHWESCRRMKVDDAPVLSSPTSKGGSSEDYSSPVKMCRSEERIIPVSEWGSSFSTHLTETTEIFVSRKKKKRKRIPDRFRRVFPALSQSPVSKDLGPTVSINKSSFYSNGGEAASSWKAATRTLSPSLSSSNKKRNLLKVSSAQGSNRVSKRRVQIYGTNKGVSHGIKKPKKKKVKPKNENKKPKIPNKTQLREENAVSISPKILVENSLSKTPLSSKKQIFKFTPKSSKKGSFNVSSDRTKVSYEIIGGQMVFRKHQEDSPCRTPEPETTVTPKKSNKLFSPTTNFFNSPPKKKIKLVDTKSPVKFSVIEELEAPTEGEMLSDIIVKLNCQYDDINGSDKAEQNKEIEKIAIETEEQIRSLFSHEEVLFEVPVTTDIQVIDNVQDSSKIVYSMDQDRTGMRKNISDIISNIQINGSVVMPNEEEKVIETDEQGQSFFPIFYQSSADSGLEDISNHTELKKPPQFRRSLFKAIPGNAQDGMTQMVIDAGQSRVGAQLCLTCSTLFTIGDEEDEQNHRLIHNGILDQISFNGWQNERVVRYLPEVGRRIIMLDPSNKETRHWEKNKLLSVLSVVDKTIGSVTQLDKCNSPMAFLYIADKMVVGLLLAEKASKAHKMNDDGLTYNEDEPVQVLAGISRLWVMPEYQRQGIATKLADSFRENFFTSSGAYYLKMSKLSFSQTTPNGTAFASQYTGTKNFLVYQPKN
ncbi:uncharacterized protein eco [Lepeophtheirus salmonis]|uniref:uncharacterized protein eco n=1 Tax=Lepeophtheirus salmonis TaxID=72036 RepID=UPI001AE1457F|nr:N-acetyltransferase ESCO2-like [Lepeophtheirus salmonis]